MKNPIFFKDHVVEYPNRYLENDLGNNLVSLTKSPGTVVQQGTPLNASNFNNVDLGGIQGILVGLLTAQHAHQLSQKVEGLEGEQIEVTLTNTQSYPFNNSVTTVSLSQRRTTKDYSVAVELLDKTGGGAGDIVISDKLLNGFKIAFTGAASSVKVNCIIRGGI